MKAKNRKTGEIIDIIAYNSDIERDSTDNVSYIDSHGIEHYHESGLNYYWDFEPVEDSRANHINWGQRRYELAKAAMQGILSNEDEVDYAYDYFDSKFKGKDHTYERCVAEFALACADALIEQLKED